jgi:hypothetical protein
MSDRQGQHELQSERIFHEREWRIQRIGWTLLTVFLALALAGLFGGGPLSHAHALGAQGRIDYERFIRQGSPTELVITPSNGAARGISIEITADYLAAFRVDDITPTPTTVRIAGDRLVYEFATAEPGASIAFHFDPQRLWHRRALVKIGGGAPLRIWQITYP